MKKFTKPLALLLALVMVIGLLPVTAFAAEMPSDDNFAVRPSNANIFFTSGTSEAIGNTWPSGYTEAYTFNTATYWDIYQQELGVPQGTHAVSSNSPNYGLTLQSSTDGAIVKGESFDVSLEADKGKWGDFAAGRILEFKDVKLGEGNNDITIAFSGTGPDIRTLSIFNSNGEEVASLTPSGINNNVKSDTTNAGDTNVKSSAADNRNDGWMETVGTAAYKCADGTNGCFGYTGNASVIYHFAGQSAERITEGTYTLKLEYTYGGDSDTNTQVGVTVKGTTSSTTTTSSDVLRIDFETAENYIYQQYNINNSSMDTKFAYSDGSSTVVGWGGDLRYQESAFADRFTIAMKPITDVDKDGDVDQDDLDKVLDYLTIYLVDKNGDVVGLTRGGSEKYGEEGISGTELKSATAEWKNENSAGSEPFFNADGYYSYVSKNFNATDQIQGIKLVFGKGNNDFDISGTIEVSFVGLYKSGNWKGDKSFAENVARTNWYDFSPFTSGHNNKRSIDNQDTFKEEFNAALNTKVEPFLRSSATLWKAVDKIYTHSGYNLSTEKVNDQEWHMWTMSTSDANIVDKSWSDKNGTGTYNALEIKYRNDSAHRTTTSLTLDTGKRTAPTGQWLVINLKGEADYLQGSVRDNAEEVLKIGVKLNDGTSIPLSNFRIAPAEGDTPFVNASKISDGYQTIYYNVGNTAIPSAGLSKVEFDFSNVGSSGAGDTHRIYVKDIYLLNPSLSISKDAPAVVDQGAEFEYSLYVWNAGEQAVTDAYTVTDTLPSGLSYVADSARIAYRKGTDVSKTYSIKPTVSGSTLSWTIDEDLYNTNGVRDNVLITFKVRQTNSAAKAGTAYVNSATVTLKGDTFTSREVITRVREKTVTVGNVVYYAEVGQKTQLPMDDITITTSDITTEALGKAQDHEIGTKDITRNGWGTANYNDITFTSVPLGNSLKGQVKLTASLKNSTSSDKDYYSTGADIGSITITGTDGFSVTLTPTSKTTGILSGSTSVTGSIETNATISDGHTSGTAGDTGGPRQNTFVTYIFDGLPEGVYTVTVKAATGFNNIKLTLTANYADVTTSTIPGGTQKISMTPVSVRDFSNGGSATITDGKLYYTSTKTGIETFALDYTADSTSGTTTVTVYNYQVKDHVYVLDYGLPVDLTDTSAGNNSGLLEDATLTVAGADTGYAFSGLKASKRNNDGVADSSDYTTPYGAESLGAPHLKNGTAAYTAAPESEALKVTFTPTEFMSDVDTFYYGVQVSKNGTVTPPDATNATPVMEGEIKVMPANVVYYEDNFVAVKYEGENKTEGEYTAPTQSNDQEEQYGHDDAYELDVTDSAGSSTMLTAKKDENGNYTTKAKFTFKGTGFEIVGRSTDESTVLTYIITEVGQTSVVKMGVVDTLYRNGDLYQIPVIHVDDLEYKEYDVTIGVSFSGVDENGKAARSVFYLDGIRIFNPLGTDGNNAYLDSEKGAKIVNVRDMIVGNGTVTENGIVDSDGYLTSEYAPISGSTATLMKLDDYGLYVKPVNTTESTTDFAKDVEEILDYLNAGPNNEVYLGSSGGNRAALAFVVEGNPSLTDNTLQIEAKAVQLTQDQNNKHQPNVKLEMITAYNHDSDDEEGNPLYSTTTLNLVDSENSNAQLTTTTGMYYRIPVDKAIPLSNSKYLVILLGDGDDYYGISYSNLKYNGYSLVETPIKNEDGNAVVATLGSYIAFPSFDAEPEFVSLEQKTKGSIRKQASVEYMVVVSGTAAESIQSKENLYVTDGGNRVYTVTGFATHQEDGDSLAVSFKIKAPNAVGSFTVEVHYRDKDGNISNEFISTELKVVASSAKKR